MPTRQIVVFLALVLVLFVAILELARRRVLRVEYSWLWIASCLTTVLLILRYDPVSYTHLTLPTNREV